jgi:hypothetical protein
VPAERVEVLDDATGLLSGVAQAGELAVDETPLNAASGRSRSRSIKAAMIASRSSSNVACDLMERGSCSALAR